MKIFSLGQGQAKKWNPFVLEGQSKPLANKQQMAATLQKTKPPLLSAPAPAASGSGPASSSSITSLFRGPGRFTPSVAPVLMTPTGLLVSVDEGLGNGHPVRSLKAEELRSPPNDDTNNIAREAKGEDTTGGEQEEGGGTTTTTTTRTTTTGTENYRGEAAKRP